MPCRIDWRPSRWLVGALCGLALLSALSVMLSGLPAQMKPMFAGLAAMGGLGLARREALRPPVSLAWSGAGLLAIDPEGQSQALIAPVLREQGPLLRIEARMPTGRRWSRTWWPDTLPAARRRQVRLAFSVSPRSGINLPSMAA
ncbi:hypothetical protein [Arenimonas sp.]|uniref:hypothetical protein n=1 Tax=Arenimonas sp. TaxID=1872635 RepID=UPI0035B1F49A